MKRQPGRADRTARTRALGSACLLAAVFATTISRADDPLFVSTIISPTTPPEYPAGIEGPAVDAAGNLYVVNFKRKGTIGRLKPGAAKSELFTPLPDGSIGNGIRFDGAGRMYIADHKQQNIFFIEPGSTTPRKYFKAHRNTEGRPQFNQPNDLAIARDGTLYASDPKAGDGTGRIWRITRGSDGRGRGAIMSSTRVMGITNGLDLSPDNKTLYVSESQFKRAHHPTRPASIWAYRIDGTALADPRRIFEFPDDDADGLRVDTDGRIFVARPDHGTIALVTPDGHSEDKVTLHGKGPTNLTFGGPDGRDVYVTQSDGGFIERFRTDRPGREPCLRAGISGCTPVAP
jgi:sugar lactone lactonase YvrE